MNPELKQLIAEAVMKYDRMTPAQRGSMITSSVVRSSAACALPAETMASGARWWTGLCRRSRMEIERMDKRCGTCSYFIFGMRSYCGWQWEPGAQALSSAFKSGGRGHAMWVDDGKDCPTWEAQPAAHEQETKA